MGYLQEDFKISQRRACRVLVFQRSTCLSRSVKGEQAALRMRRRRREIAAARVRYGYMRIHVLLKREGWKVNHKRVYHIYHEEGPNLRAKRPRRRVSAAPRVGRPEITGLNECWSMDFVTDTLYDGRRFRALTIVDNFSRECLGIKVDQSIRGQHVADLLERICFSRGAPETIRVDYGPEFTAKAVREWLDRLGNTIRPHSSLGGKPPAPETMAWVPPEAMPPPASEVVLH